MMKVGIRIPSVLVLSALLSGLVLAAPSLDITKGPVLPVPSNSGPKIDPDAQQGQWFLNERTGNEEVRTHEFYDNARSPALKGGASGHLAIYGFVSNIVYDTSGVNIVAFNIYATITNDLPDQEAWLPGDNSHGETLRTPDQYVGDLLGTKLTAEFAVPPWPVLLLPGNVGVYRDFQPRIVAENYDQLGWYCWTPNNPDPDKVPWGSYYVPTWDFGDIPLGTQATRVLTFSVDGAGLDPSDPRYLAIEQSYNNDYDILLNRTTSLKISTWQDDLALDQAVPYPHLEDLPLFRSSNCSVFHNIGELPPPMEGGLSLPVTKPPLQAVRNAWTGPIQDPDAVQGQWFLDIRRGVEEVRSHEYYDPVGTGGLPAGPAKSGGAPPKRAASAIYGYATNVQYDAQQNIVAFAIEATITNLTPWPYEWAEDGNSHDEWTDARTQYEGTLYDTKLTAEFAVDILTGLGGLPPAGIIYPPYRDTDPHICAENHDQLGWYCWTPDNPNTDKVPWGNYYVPTWDFGDIPAGAATTRTLKFTVDMGGLPPGDPRYAVIQDSAANLTDLLLNRTTSLKISTWIDDLAADTGVPYPHMVDQTPLRSSDVSVFHNTKPRIPIAATLDWDWVYQNAPLTLGWVHKSILTIAIGADPFGNTVYSSTVTANPASTGVVQIVATANPLVWEIYGGRHGVDPQGMVQLDVTVYGMDVGGQGKAIDNIKVRLLGDIDDNGGAAPGDVSMLIMKLNGTPPPGIPDPRAFDLDANGGAAPGDVSILINILNGIPMP